MRALVLTLLLAASGGAGAARYCAGTVLRDPTFGMIYRALLRPDLACLAEGGVLRVRRVSGVNPGLSYPGGLTEFGGLWGWEITSAWSPVPERALWTLPSWRWQRWDGERWLNLGARP